MNANANIACFGQPITQNPLTILIKQMFCIFAGVVAEELRCKTQFCITLVFCKYQPTILTMHTVMVTVTVVTVYKIKGRVFLLMNNSCGFSGVKKRNFT